MLLDVTLPAAVTKTPYVAPLIVLPETVAAPATSMPSLPPFTVFSDTKLEGELATTPVPEALAATTLPDTLPPTLIAVEMPTTPPATKFFLIEAVSVDGV